MNLSGIVVAVAPQEFDDGITALNHFKNLKIYQSDQSKGQIVVVQEAENVNMEIDGLKKIKALPMVTYAEMIYHYIEDDNETEITPPSDIDSINLDETLKKLNN